MGIKRYRFPNSHRTPRRIDVNFSCKYLLQTMVTISRPVACLPTHDHPLRNFKLHEDVIFEYGFIATNFLIKVGSLYGEREPIMGVWGCTVQSPAGSLGRVGLCRHCHNSQPDSHLGISNEYLCIFIRLFFIFTT